MIKAVKSHLQLTLANDIASQPMILGIAAIISDCKSTKKAESRNSNLIVSHCLHNFCFAQWTETPLIIKCVHIGNEKDFSCSFISLDEDWSQQTHEGALF